MTALETVKNAIKMENITKRFGSVVANNAVNMELHEGEILSLLGVDSIDTLRTRANAIWNANYRDDGAVTSLLADSIWLDESVSYHKETLKRLKKECPIAKGQTIPQALIAFAMSSRANLAMVPIQDYLELTNDQGRMNIPAVAQGNWSWRLNAGYATEELTGKICSVTTAHNRHRR